MCGGKSGVRVCMVGKLGVRMCVVGGVEEGLSGGEEWDELWAPASDVDLLLVSYMFSTISRVYKYWETQTTSCQFIGVTRVNRVNVPSPGAIPQVLIIPCM